MISKTKTQCPKCGSKVFSVYNEDGWRISCSHCVYISKPSFTELGAENNYRQDFNKAFDKGKTNAKEIKEIASELSVRRAYVPTD